MNKFFLLGLCCLPLTSFSANWVEYDTSGSNSTIYYDKSSVKVKRFPNGKKYIQAWEKYIYDTEQYNNSYHSNCSIYSSSLCNKPYTSIKSIEYYDCWGDKYTTGKEFFYNNDGSVVDSSNRVVNEASSLTWSEPIPDTIGQGKLQEICYAYRNQLK